MGPGGNTFLGKPLQQGPAADLEGVDPGSGRRGDVAGPQKRLAAVKAQALVHLSHEPLGMAVADGQIVQLWPAGHLRQMAQVPLEGPEHTVGIACGGGAGGFFNQLHRFMDSGAVGDAGEKDQLICPQTQRVQHLGRQLFHRAGGKLPNEEIQPGPVLQHAVGQIGSERRFFPTHIPAGLFQIQVGPGALAAESDQGAQRRFTGGQHQSFRVRLAIISRRNSWARAWASAAT